MMATARTYTVNDIKELVRATGSHWFDPSTMRFFGTRVLPTVYQGPGGVYFVTSDHTFDRQRKYTVRQFKPDFVIIDTVGELASIATRAQAVRIAKSKAAGGWVGAMATEQQGGVPLALGGISETTEEYRKVSRLDQFAHDLQKHTNPARGTEATTAKAARELMAMGKRYHRYMELLCGDEAFCRQCNEDGEHPRVIALRGKIGKLAKSIGCTGVVFSGDPRGCTVKLQFADGYTDDMGKEGLCVPGA